MSPELHAALFAEEWRAEGRRFAFHFAIECDGDEARIKEKLEWHEHELTDPQATARGQPFAPNTSVRLHAEGFAPGLRDALQMIRAHASRQQH